MAINCDCRCATHVAKYIYFYLLGKINANNICWVKKTIFGYGLLLIEMGEDFSAAKLVPAIRKQEKSSGNL